jgi:hypothetical protein
MAAKRKDAIAESRTIAEAMAKALCEAGMPTTAVKLERVWRVAASKGPLTFTSGFDARTASQIRVANTVAHLDELARVVQRLVGEANELLKTKPPVLEWPGYLNFLDVNLIAHYLKILTDALARYEVHKEHALGDPEPFEALVGLVHTLNYLLPLMYKMSHDRDRMTALRENILRPTNRKSLDARIAKEIPGYLRDHQREGARGWGVRYVARRLYPILKARGLWTKSEGALRKHLERHHREYFVPF